MTVDLLVGESRYIEGMRAGEYPSVLANMAAIEAAAAGSYQLLGWTNDDEGAEPLMLDMTTAHMLMLVYNAMDEEYQARFLRVALKSRAHFGRLVESMWKYVS